MKCSLPTTNIDKIGLYTTNLEMHFYHLVYHIGPEYSNPQRNILYIEKSVIGQVIILTKSEIIQKRNLVIVTPNIKHD